MRNVSLWLFSLLQIASVEAKNTICDSTDIYQFFSYIDSYACDDNRCNIGDLSELNKRNREANFRKMLKQKGIAVVHLFYPDGVVEHDRAYQWQQNKKLQLLALPARIDNATAETTVYIIGKASADGSKENLELSSRRSLSVKGFIERELSDHFFAIKSVWVGADALILTASTNDRYTDAIKIGIYHGDYAGNKKAINQAVHVIVLPCRFGKGIPHGR